MSDPQGPRLADDAPSEFSDDRPGFLAWVAKTRDDEDFANLLGAAIKGGETAGIDTADVLTKAMDIVAHGGHAGELTEAVRDWIRRGGQGTRPRAARQRRQAPLAVVARPPWCGQCSDEVRRQTLTDLPARCPNCHPLTQSAKETA